MDLGVIDSFIIPTWRPDGIGSAVETTTLQWALNGGWHTGVYDDFTNTPGPGAQDGFGVVSKSSKNGDVIGNSPRMFLRTTTDISQYSNESLKFYLFTSTSTLTECYMIGGLDVFTEFGTVKYNNLIAQETSAARWLAGLREFNTTGTVALVNGDYFQIDITAYVDFPNDLHPCSHFINFVGIEVL